MYDDIFYDRLAKLRINKGISARDMSLSLGQSAGYINNIENKKNLPSMRVFFYICEFLGLSPCEFFDTDSDNPEKLKYLIHDLKSLSDDQLALISALIKDLIK